MLGDAGRDEINPGFEREMVHSTGFADSYLNSFDAAFIEDER